MIQRYRYLLEALAIIVITGIIGVVVAFSGSLSRTESDAPVVINEVYPAFQAEVPVPQQWFELYNRNEEWHVLEGWTVEMTAGVRLALPRIVLAPQGYAVVALSKDQFLAAYPGFPGQVVGLQGSSSGLGMSLAKGYLVLRDAQGRVVDAVNWGRPDRPPADVTLWEAPAFEPGSGWAGKVSSSLERRPLGLDTDRSSDFIRQPFPSPGTVNLPSATSGAYSFFIDWTNAAAVGGGILLWIAFVFIALIARRFEALTQQRTYWWAMLVAPIGILVYNLIQAYGFLVRGRMLLEEQWAGFVTLFVSALVCTILVYIFRRRAKRILEG